MHAHRPQSISCHVREKYLALRRCVQLYIELSCFNPLTVTKCIENGHEPLQDKKSEDLNVSLIKQQWYRQGSGQAAKVQKSRNNPRSNTNYPRR